MVKSIGQFIKTNCLYPYQQKSPEERKKRGLLECIGGASFAALGLALFAVIDRRYKAVRIFGGAAATFGVALAGRGAYILVTTKKAVEKRFGIDQLFEGSERSFNTLTPYPVIISESGEQRVDPKNMGNHCIMKGKSKEGYEFIAAKIEATVTKEKRAQLEKEGKDVSRIRENAKETKLNYVLMIYQSNTFGEKGWRQLFRGNPLEPCFLIRFPFLQALVV